LRQRVAEQGGPTEFSQLLYSALYTRTAPVAGLFTPDPTHFHRHLVAMFAGQAGRIWTTNYDDLLEAACPSRVPRYTLSPDRRDFKAGFTIAHLHGYMPPIERAADVDLDHTTVILAEDDFHQISTDAVGWTNREFHRLFDEHRVLIFGMSLDDPNLRRAL